MARTRPADRLTRVADAALHVFIRDGYRRALMADVAKEVGVSQGLLYTYVSSKEALFHLAALRAVGEDIDERADLPLPTPPMSETADVLAGMLMKGHGVAGLERALRSEAAEDPTAELEEVVRSLYRATARRRLALTLVDRCAGDLPELRERFFVGGRRRLVDRLASYLEKRIGQGVFRPVPDTAVAARVVLETTAWFANHRHRDLDAATIDDDAAEATVVDMLVASLAPARRR